MMAQAIFQQMNMMKKYPSVPKILKWTTLTNNAKPENMLQIPKTINQNQR